MFVETPTKLSRTIKSREDRLLIVCVVAGGEFGARKILILTLDTAKTTLRSTLSADNGVNDANELVDKVSLAQDENSITTRISLMSSASSEKGAKATS